MAALEGTVRSASVSAAQRVEAIEISPDDFLRFAENDSAAARGMMRMLSIRQRFRMRQTLDFNQYDAGTRLARTLVALAEKCGVRTDEGISLDILITQADLAPLVGASEPGIHKALRPLREARVPGPLPRARRPRRTRGAGRRRDGTAGERLDRHPPAPGPPAGRPPR
jgi:CRP/FNR family transcriptional regulator, cyclic AMP receptor protein